MKPQKRRGRISTLPPKVRSGWPSERRLQAAEQPFCFRLPRKRGVPGQSQVARRRGAKKGCFEISKLECRRCTPTLSCTRGLLRPRRPRSGPSSVEVAALGDWFLDLLCPDKRHRGSCLVFGVWCFPLPLVRGITKSSFSMIAGSIIGAYTPGKSRRVHERAKPKESLDFSISIACRAEKG
jgi:hypothetical protein